jgi:hypothetical protein
MWNLSTQSTCAPSKRGRPPRDDSDGCATKPFPIRVTPDEHERLRSVASGDHTSLSDFVRTAIGNLVAEYREDPSAFVTSPQPLAHGPSTPSSCALGKVVLLMLTSTGASCVCCTSLGFGMYAGIRCRAMNVSAGSSISSTAPCHADALARRDWLVAADPRHPDIARILE